MRNELGPPRSIVGLPDLSFRLRNGLMHSFYRHIEGGRVVILTESERPTSITLAAFTTADRHLIVNFEPDSSRREPQARCLRLYSCKKLSKMICTTPCWTIRACTH